MKVGIAGASGYIGGELLRLLYQHPHVEVTAVSSDSNAGKRISSIHPHLRGVTEARFCKTNELKDIDFCFLAVPHTKSFGLTKTLMETGVKIVNKSGDFRLHDAKEYEKWYGVQHPHPELLTQFTYGIPELYGEKIAQAQCVAAPGCIATATILATYPLVAEKLVEPRIIADAKIGSSAAGTTPDLSTHHPSRSHVMRSYKPTGHRHTAEIEQSLRMHERVDVNLSATAVEAVRGVLSTIHAFPVHEIKEVELWKAYRKYYSGRRFVRVTADKESLFGFPEPKLVSGTNYCDVGFTLDTHKSRIVALGALDNLVKGGAGQGVQCMNLMSGFAEEEGLSFTGLYPS